MAGKVPWNRGLTWAEMYSSGLLSTLQDGALARMRIAQRALAGAPQLEAQRRVRLSQVALERRLGGYERGSGRGKKGWYCGYWCDSTYELAFVVWALDHEIPFERNARVYHYEHEGRVKRWIPDFRLADGTFVEIKGYVSDQALAKFANFLPSLRVLTESELKPIFDYVRCKYGRDLVALYE